jgi:hypothetical protein
VNARLISAATAALLVTACGGSESKGTSGRDISYSGPTTVAAISTPAAAQQATTGVLASLQSILGSAGSVNVTVAATGSAPAFTPAQAAQLAASYFPQVSAAQVAGVAVQQTDACTVSGSTTVAGSVRDQAGGGLYTGDYVQVTFNACSQSAGQLITGSARVEIVAGNGDRFFADPPVFTPGYTYRVRVTLSDLSVSGADGYWFGVDGDAELALTQRATPVEVETSVSGTSLVFLAGQGNTILDGARISPPAGQSRYSSLNVEEYVSGLTSPVTAERSGVNATLCTAEIGGCLQVVTAPAFRKLTADANPSAGSMTLTAGKARITVTAISATNVDVTYDLDVDALPAATTVHTTWACLDAPAPTCAAF